MYAAGCNSHQNVSGLHLAAVDEIGFLHAAYGETGDVIFSVSVHTRHFGSLAAYQCASGLAAALCHTCDYGLHFCRLVVAHGHIVQEYKRLGALCEYVVYAHRNGVNADRVVFVHCESQFQLGADTVSAANQHRLAITQGCEVEHSAESADVAHHARTVGGSDVLLDPPYYVVAGFEVHTGLFITLCHISQFSVSVYIVVGYSPLKQAKQSSHLPFAALRVDSLERKWRESA